MKNGDHIEIDGFGLNKSDKIPIDDEDEDLKMTIMLGKRGSAYTMCMLGEEYLSRHHYYLRKVIVMCVLNIWFLRMFARF